MTATSVSSVIPVTNMAAAVERWEQLLGLPPTFVDGDRWAQFDVGGTRVSLAGTDRTTEIAGLMVKTEHLETVRELLKESGLIVSELVDGSHERRFTVDGLEVPVTIYSSHQST
ncbi:MAG: bleomycin resistance protein [Actinomycetota bacterium]|jgi:hypothetical protein|nr:bleomycin resistance protein [Actinomycetota bacterium]|tara:strand:+ start:9808 stop:10149 length:342 start_codon:yes stop_codon:yes gene_type:complete